jgi:uncharacterized membrane protein YgdD (TMEM256/DUF423 family)
VFVFKRIIPYSNLPMENAPRWIAFSAGVLGFVGVVLGALGAHALKVTLLSHSSVDTWHTAVLYHLVHSVAILAVGRGLFTDGKAMIWAAGCWIIGIILFCGSLYGLALGGPTMLGPITPLGGVAFLAGWAVVAVKSFKSPSNGANA